VSAVCDLLAFVAARLDDWEPGADEDKRDNGQCDDLTGWHMSAAEMRRLVDSLRRVVTDTFGGPDHEDMWLHHLKLLAEIWSDHADYRQEWKP
jgi:hypothetical protein